MSGNVEPRFHGQYDWSLPDDWREVTAIAEEALKLLTHFMNLKDGEVAPLSYLSDVAGAADFILQVPPNMRSKSFDAFNKQAQSWSAPRLSAVRTLIGLWANPIETGLKLLMFGIARSEHKEIDMVEIIAKEVREEATLMQLDSCLNEPKVKKGRLLLDPIHTYANRHAIAESSHSGDETFERNLGRTVYWYAFQEQEHWEVPQRLELTPDLANDAMKRHKEQRIAEYRNPAFLFNLWLNSPFCDEPLKALRRRDKYVKKMSRGRRFKDIEKAWASHLGSIEKRHRYVYLFAERAKWEAA